MSSWYVVKAEPCTGVTFRCDVKPGYRACVNCHSDGTRLDVSSAVPVERHTIAGWSNVRGLLVSQGGWDNPPKPLGTPDVFVPVESSSSGEGGDQWPEATGDTVRENTEVAPSESVRLVAEAPEGTQPPGLSDGDER